MKYNLIIVIFFVIQMNFSQKKFISSLAAPTKKSELLIKKINGLDVYIDKRINEKADGKYAIFIENLQPPTDIIPILSSYDYLVDQGTFNKGYKNGLWKTLYKNKLVKTMNYRNGLVIGRYRVYNTKGELLYKTTFGKYGNGRYKDYDYKTGVLKQQGNYKNGKKEGKWFNYDQNGHIKDSICYKKGMPIKK